MENIAALTLVITAITESCTASKNTFAVSRLASSPPTDPPCPPKDLLALKDLLNENFISGNLMPNGSGFPAHFYGVRITIKGRSYLEELEHKESDLSAQNASTKIGQNDCNKKATNENAQNECGSYPVKEITSPDGDNGVESKSVWILLGALDAGVILLFWGYSEFFGNHNSPILSNICFFGFSASVLAALAGFTFKHWPHVIIICSIYFLLCGFSGVIIYEYSKPSPPNPTESNPSDIRNQNLISIEPDASLDPKNPIRTRFIIQNTGSYEINDVNGSALATDNIPRRIETFNSKSNAPYYH
jgi:hypothetical protein